MATPIMKRQGELIHGKPDVAALGTKDLDSLV